MSLIRKISVLIWNDDKFPLLSDDAQMVFLHLLTTPATTEFGLFKAGVRGLAEEKRWNSKRYDNALIELIDCQMVRYDSRALVVYVPKALHYNVPADVNTLEAWSIKFAEVPRSELKEAFHHDLRLRLEKAGCDELITAFNTHFNLAKLDASKDNIPEWDLSERLTSSLLPLDQCHDSSIDASLGGWDYVSSISPMPELTKVERSSKDNMPEWDLSGRLTSSLSPLEQFHDTSIDTSLGGWDLSSLSPIPGLTKVEG